MRAQRGDRSSPSTPDCYEPVNSVARWSELAGTLPDSTKAWLYASWIVFGLSMVFGVIALMTITSLLAGPTPKEERRECEALSVDEIPWHPQVRRRGGIQIFLFGIGVGLLATFGWFAIT